MNNDNLEQRAVATLGNESASAIELAELIREVESALEESHAAVEEARRVSADPVLSPDPVLARERVRAAEFADDRAAALLSRLEDRL
jgi:hypothetical protein